MLRCKDGGKELCLSRTGGSDRLRLSAVGNSASTEEESIAGSGASFAKLVRMGSIDKANKLVG